MIVVPTLPERSACSFEERKCRVTLESRDKPKQVRPRGVSFRQEMQMIGHQAIGMQDKQMLLGLAAQVAQHPEPEGVIAKMLLAIMAANRDEVDSMT